MESLKKYNYIGPKTEQEQRESDFIAKVEKYKEIILEGPGLTFESYENFLEVINILIDIEQEELKESLKKGEDHERVAALKRFIESLDNEKNPFEHRDGVPN
jgi:hypothetical protein